MADVAVETLIEAGEWAERDLETLASRAAEATLDHLGIEGSFEIAVLGCDDDRIACLNADFRGKPVPTNVLSWPSEDRAAANDGDRPAPPSGPDPELGNIAIALGTCRREAEAGGLSVADHATHLLVHAVLHLLGYDHERPEDGDLMERMEVEILARMGLADPYNRAGDTPGHSGKVT